MRLTQSDVLCKKILCVSLRHLTFLIAQATYHLYFTVLMSILLLNLIVVLNLILFLFLRLVLGNLAAWVRGACIVYPSEVFDPRMIVNALVQEQCSALHGVPTHFLGILAEVDRRHRKGDKLDLNKLRQVS
jgi:hypothetical protein